MTYRVRGTILHTRQQPDVMTLKPYIYPAIHVSPGVAPLPVPHQEPMRCSIAERVRQLPERERKLMLKLLSDWQTLIR
jgi:hypothetical protein